MDANERAGPPAEFPPPAEAQARVLLGAIAVQERDRTPTPPTPRGAPRDDAWSELVRWAERMYASRGFAERELNQLLETSEHLRRARGALLAGTGRSSGWAGLLARALAPAEAFVPRAVLTRFQKWCAARPDRARRALRALWADDAALAERIRAFLEDLPAGVARGVSARLSLTSLLLLALDPMRYPVYVPGAFTEGFALTGYPRPRRGVDEADVYDHALGFLDRLIQEASRRNLHLRHRLHAAGVLQAITRGADRWQPPQDWSPEVCEAFQRYLAGARRPRGAAGEPAPMARRPVLASLASSLLIDELALLRIERLLADKKQCIFYGPPGTGKTYVARELARALAAGAERVQVVQFHPSYAYEDFVEGYRPRLINGQPGFALVDGPLKRMAQAAREAPEATHILVIDELNRGNVAKIFGELYYLLEYRDEQVTLQYSGAPFTLPRNLWIIGTMNTADRSIALVDLALRRRFYFVPFFPDQPPVAGLLRRWLERNKPDLVWLADAVDRANALLKDRHLAIGPSYFLRPDLTEEWVEVIWEHAVLPYLAEQFFGEEGALEEFALPRLRAACPPPSQPSLRYAPSRRRLPAAAERHTAYDAERGPSEATGRRRDGPQT
jgi:MoxR-like ATPase